MVQLHLSERRTLSAVHIDSDENVYFGLDGGTSIGTPGCFTAEQSKILETCGGLALAVI